MDATLRPVQPSDYVALLGSNLVALWHQGQGVTLSGTNVQSWADVIASRVVTPVFSGAAPQYLADGSSFNAKPVVQFSAGAKCLVTAVAQILAAGQRPFVFCVRRWRNGLTADAYAWQLNETQDMVHWSQDIAGTQFLQFKQPGTVYASNGGHTVLQHFETAWLDGALGHFTRDGADGTTAATGALAPIVDVIYLGGSNRGPLSLGMWGMCTAVPSAQQRIDLAALVARDFG